MSIDTALIILGFILMVAGVLGAVVPVLPGPPLSFAGFILVHFSSKVSFSASQLWIFGLLSLFITIIDYYLPVWGTKKAKGNKHTVFGATIGLIIGLVFFFPYGILFGPFIGAWLAGKVNGMSDRDALLSALGSFAGLFMGMVLKFFLAVSMIYATVKILL
jgi:uncharacterized protein